MASRLGSDFEENAIRLMKARVILAASVSLAANALAQGPDPLPSWNDGPTKQAITRFVNDTSRPGGTSFVPVPERIAVFDNDGTMWAEQPMYFQLAFALDRVGELASSHPEWETTEPFTSVLRGDLQPVVAGGHRVLIEILMASHANNTTDDFAAAVTKWLASARHPRFERPYTDIVYQPMLELVAFLRANGYKTHIVSGGGVEFMRVFTEEVYGIPPEQVVGSSIETRFEMRDGKAVLARLPEIDFIDDKEGKPVGIHRFIGRRPVMAFGNSDGDLQVLQWTSAGDGPRFAALVHHTDAEREWAYDRGSPIGGLDVALGEALDEGWTVVDIKRDWRTVFPFER